MINLYRVIMVNQKQPKNVEYFNYFVIMITNNAN
jgi:hypothetical protein